MPLVDTLNSLERALSWRRTAILVAGATIAWFAFSSWYASSAHGAEPKRNTTRVENSSLRWRAASTRTVKPTAESGIVATSTTDEEALNEGRPALLDTTNAQPIPVSTSAVAIASNSRNGSSPPCPQRDNSIRLTQATGPVKDAISDPFGDGLKKSDTLIQTAPATAKPMPGSTIEAAPRLLEPRSPNETPSGAPALPPANQLPSAGQLAVGGGNFLEEKCPQLSELKAISAITNNVTAAPGELPRECYFNESVLSPSNRPWMVTNFAWKASGLCHKPLYFEQVSLERYGHSTGPLSQPFVNAAYFLGSFIVQPYKMGIEAPWECKYALGYYRPGSCAPYIIPPVPISARGAALQAGTGAALIYALP